MRAVMLQFVKARNGAWCVLLLGGLAGVALALARVPVPSLRGPQATYTGVVFLTFSPVLAAVIVLGAVHSGLVDWERLARRNLVPLRALWSTCATTMAVLSLMPAGLASGAAGDSSSLVRGTLLCVSAGILASNWLSYVGQVAMVFSVGVLSVNLVSLGVVHGRWLHVLVGPQPESGVPWPAVICGVLAIAFSAAVPPSGQRSTP